METSDLNLIPSNMSYDYFCTLLFMMKSHAYEQERNNPSVSRDISFERLAFCTFDENDKVIDCEDDVYDYEYIYEKVKTATSWFIDLWWESNELQRSEYNGETLHYNHSLNSPINTIMLSL